MTLARRSYLMMLHAIPWCLGGFLATVAMCFLALFFCSCAGSSKGVIEDMDMVAPQDSIYLVEPCLSTEEYKANGLTENEIWFLQEGCRDLDEIRKLTERAEP